MMKWLGLVVIGGIIAIACWQFFRPGQQAPTQTVVPLPISSAQTPAEIRHPVVSAEEDLKSAAPIIDLGQPLPTLQQSDTPMAEILAKLFADQKLDRFFILEHFIERFVVMVDNLPRPQLPSTHRPLKKTPGTFLASGEPGQKIIDPANYQRYIPMLNLLASLDTRQVVAVYRGLYPLFQEAYAGLGYPDAYFNDRLVAVIDHLLTTPPVSGPVYLLQPKVLYLYADPEIEELSAGRKILLRSGPENTARIKEILHKYRQELTSKQ